MTLGVTVQDSLRPNQSYFASDSSCASKAAFTDTKKESECLTFVCDSHLMLFTAQGSHMKTNLLDSFGQHCLLRPLPQRVKHRMSVPV